MRRVNILLGIFVFFLTTSYVPVTGPTNVGRTIGPDEVDTRQMLIFDLVNEAMQRGHYAPAIINDAYSQNVFDYYLNLLDRNKRFLLAEDISDLKKSEFLIDDQVRMNDLSFFELSYSLIEKRILEVKEEYTQILAAPLNYQQDEWIETDPEKRDFPISSEERKDQWRQSLKLSVMGRIITKTKEQEAAIEKNDTSVTLQNFEEIEKWAREKVTKSYDSYFKRLGKLKKADRFADFVNALVSIYDPHTGYYPPKEKENFDIYMSGQLEGIGAQLQQKDGLIKVSRIVAGSASWKQGDLKAGDFILSVAQGAEETVDVTDMRLDDAVRLIRGKKGTEVRLTVKKVDGNIVIIPIIRDVVQLEETYAKSAVLKNNSTIGYLKLPKFYVDLSKKGGGRSCALDVKAELEKLNLESVDGLILDLRNNGGGSLQDAVKIAGYFIKEGPIVQIKSRLGSPYVMKDTDPSVEYNGPLVIMVNYFSISASEIVSAALQDYNRAIIVGSRTSYGKGTVQRFFNLDELNKMNSDMSPLGAIKLTTQKFYRVNGGATQLKGVSADIELPDAYDQIDIGEAELDHYLKWDEITPSDIIRSETVKQLNLLKEMSGARIEMDSSFNLIAENAVRMKKQKDKTSFSLIFENYKAEREKSEAEAEKYDEAEKDSTGLMVNYLTNQLKSIEDDSTKLVRIKSWHKELRHDIYLHESVLILEDYLKLTE